MKIILHSDYVRLDPFLQRLPELFDGPDFGKVLHEGRNTVKLREEQGVRLVVKRYGAANRFNRYVYALVRHSKARRAYDHAARLRGLGIATPHEVACVEIIRRGQLCDSYFVSLYTEGLPFDRVLKTFPAPEALRIADAFAEFIAGVHACGVLHRDLNAGNVRYRKEADGYRFELIDTNRMSFKRKPSERECLANLRRLTHKTAPYLYICNRYAKITGNNPDRSLLRSCLYLLEFNHWVDLKQRFKTIRQKLCR